LLIYVRAYRQEDESLAPSRPHTFLAALSDPISLADISPDSPY
jgi:hypothetical protein